MSDNEIDQGETDEVLDTELKDEVLPAPTLDLEALQAEIDKRIARMQAKGRGDIAVTFSYWAKDLLQASSVQAISEAINAQAQVRMADYEARGVGEIAKNHTLAAKVLQGDFDHEETP